MTEGGSGCRPPRRSIYQRATEYLKLFKFLITRLANDRGRPRARDEYIYD